MTTERDARTRTVLSWLREDAHENAERVLLRALDEADTTPQRRPLWPPRRFLAMPNYAKVALVAAAAVLVVLLGSQILPRTDTVGGTPTRAPSTAPSTMPTGTPVPSDSPTSAAGPSAFPYSSTPESGLLPPGPIVLDGAFPLAITFDVPDGWSANGSEAEDYVGLAELRGDATPSGVSFALIGNVYPNPCHPARLFTGPTVDDLVHGLQGMKGFDSTEPTDVTIDGYAGKRFTVTARIDPSKAGCDDPVWLTLWDFPPPSGTAPARVPAGTSLEFWVLDVNGTRLAMFAEDYGATPAEFAEAVGVIESVRFR